MAWKVRLMRRSDDGAMQQLDEAVCMTEPGREAFVLTLADRMLHSEWCGCLFINVQPATEAEEAEAYAADIAPGLPS